MVRAVTKPHGPIPTVSVDGDCDAIGGEGSGGFRGLAQLRKAYDCLKRRRLWRVFAQITRNNFILQQDLSGSQASHSWPITNP